MEELFNPYTPGAGTPPRELAGRDAEIRAFDLLLGRLQRGLSEQSLIINGLRGVGKTVLLIEFENRATEAGWGVGKLEQKRTTEFRAAVAEMAKDALRQVSRAGRGKDALLRAARAIRSFTMSTNESGGMDFRVDLEAALTGQVGLDLESDLIDLFVQIGTAAQESGTGLVFFIDEMQLLSKDDLEALCAAMHRVAQKNLPVALIGAGLPVLPELLAEAKSYAERLFVFPKLGPLPEKAARLAIEQPAKTIYKDRQIRYEPAAVDLVLEASQGYPYFLQAYGKHAWNTAPEGDIIRAVDVDRARAQALAELDRDFFETRFDRTTNAARRYMAAMAELGDGPYASLDVATRGGWAGIKAASPTRQALINKGLIWAPDHGLIDFTVPYFADFMRRRHPMSSF